MAGSSKAEPGKRSEQVPEGTKDPGVGGEKNRNHASKVHGMLPLQWVSDHIFVARLTNNGEPGNRFNWALELPGIDPKPSGLIK